MTRGPRDQDALEHAAYEVADACRNAGPLPRVGDRWETTWAEMCNELERRCPGFTPEEYRDALNKGFTDSR